MFKIVREPIQPISEPSAAAGGYVTFEGRVRDRNDGRDVVSVEYEAFDSMVEREGAAIITEAIERFGLISAHAVHRAGLLRVGETAVWIEAAGVHRAEAFAACRAIIDAIKRRLPIWKKERYVDGDDEWVHCSDHALDITAKDYYARQAILPEIGQTGQQRLANASVLVVGAGGLGAPALLYLAGAGVGRIGICEPDRLEIENLHRQVIFRAEDVGRPKAQLAAAAVRALNPLIEVVPYQEAATPDNVAALIDSYDIVLDCTDSFVTKFLLNDACIDGGKPLIQASIYRYEGHVMTVRPGSEGGCLRCLWPVTPNAGCIGTCAEVGVLGTVPGLLGALQATEAIKLILNIGQPTDAEMLIIDLLTQETRRIARRSNPECPTCGAGMRTEVPLEIAWTDALRGGLLVDIREPAEALLQPHPDQVPWIVKPLSGFLDDLGVFDDDQTYILVCAHGIRSAQLAARLRDLGDTRFRSLIGGMAEIRRRCGQSTAS